MQLANATASQRLQLHKKLNFLHLLQVMQPPSPENAMLMSERSSAEGNQRPSGGKSTLHKKGEGGERSYRPSCQGGKLSFLVGGWHFVETVIGTVETVIETVVETVTNL